MEAFVVGTGVVFAGAMVILWIVSGQRNKARQEVANLKNDAKSQSKWEAERLADRDKGIASLKADLGNLQKHNEALQAEVTAASALQGEVCRGRDFWQNAHASVCSDNRSLTAQITDLLSDRAALRERVTFLEDDRKRCRDEANHWRALHDGLQLQLRGALENNQRLAAANTAAEDLRATRIALAALTDDSIALHEINERLRGDLGKIREVTETLAGYDSTLENAINKLERDHYVTGPAGD